MSPLARTSNFAVIVAALSLVFAVSGCLRSPNPPPAAAEEDEFLAGPFGELIELEHVLPGNEGPTSFTAELYEGLVVVEGDMILGTFEELTTSATAVGTQSHAVSSTTYWPATTAAPYVYEVPYVVNASFSDQYVQDTIEPAIAHWNENTNLQLVERDGETDYVEFVMVSNRCQSEVGVQGGRQEIRLSESGCTQVGTVIHEIGHTIGLKHEQQRPDRDDHVEIVWANIDPTKVGNFNLFWQGLPLGEYGYTSVMHYSATAFGLNDADGNKLTTIRTLGDPIAPAARLTDDDIAAVRRMYPEQDLPYGVITSPGGQLNVDEGAVVTFGADVVIAPTFDEDALYVTWTYDNRFGVPYTFASGDPAAPVNHSFCDGVHDVTMTANLIGHGVVASDTVRVVVNDLGMTSPPAECGVWISIDEPLDGAVYLAGEAFTLQAVIDDDHPETDAPLYPVLWRVDDPDTGTIVGTGLTSSTKLGAGQHTLYALYGAAIDSVTVTVEDAGTPPVASIGSPSDGSVHNWFTLDGQNTFLDIDFTGSGSDGEDGTLTGSALVWETRVSGSGAFNEVGSGTTPTIRFPMSVNTVTYDVRLTATDSSGMTDTDVILISIVWPPS